MYRTWRLGKKLLIFTALLIYAAPGIFSFREAEAADHPILYFFWGDGCPHCEKEKKLLNTLHERYPEVEMRWFETWNHPEFAALADAMRKAHGIATSSVPMTFIGNWSVTGYRSDDTTGLEIEEQVVACIRQKCRDPLGKLGPQKIAWTIQDQAAKNTPVGWDLYPATIPPRKDQFALIEEPTPPQMATPPETSQPPTTRPSTQNTDPGRKAGTISVPILGEINVSQTGLPLFTLIIGGLDGFNPCAMWVLCFLLTLVIYAKSRARILLIGGIFVLASGVIYFLFMIAWLNIYKLVGYIKLLTKIIGTVAIVIGLINCKDFFFFKKGISLTIPESAQPKLFKQMRKIINTSALPGVILGTIVLAVSVNLIELLCTAGLPAIYTGILEMQNFSKFQEYSYLVLYNVVYVIPLVVIVVVFAWKMGGRKLTEKEGRILKLVSGVLMLTLGIILIIKPQILMFG